MFLKIISKISCFLLTCCVLTGSGHAIPKEKPHVNKSHWTERQLPFRPFNVTAVDGTMWVCGTSEMIASSSDGGITWDLVNKKQNGDVLLNIAFVNSMVGHAAGTGGVLLTTTDGGHTWSPHHAMSTIKQFSFSGGKSGIADMDGTVMTTSDGGDHWEPVLAMGSDPNVRPFSEVESVAALDDSHMAIALHQPQGENIFLSTTDGAKSWKPLHLPNTFAGSLFVHGNEYWAFGIEYLGREHNPAGGYSAPVALHSPDARSWEHGVRATTEFNACNAQGCSLPYGVVETLYGSAETIWSLPQDLPTTGDWAIASGSVCMVKRALYCGPAIQSPTVQPPPQSASGEMFQSSYNQPIITGCLDCQLGPLAPDPKIGGLDAPEVVADFVVNADGTIKDISVSGLNSMVIAQELTQEISGWLVAPAHSDGVPSSSHRQLKIRITCFPGFPGHPGTASCLAINAAPATQLGPTVTVSN